MNFHDLLKDLELLLSYQGNAPSQLDDFNSKLHSSETRKILSEVSEGKAFVDAFRTVCNEPDSYIGRFFFGPANPIASTKSDSSIIAATAGSHLLVVAFNTADLDHTSTLEAEISALPQLALVVVVETNFDRFVFRSVKSGSVVERPFLELDHEEMATEVAFLGSMWATVFPEHRAILTRTTSFAVPKGRKSALFDAHQLRDREWKVNLARKHTRSLQEEQATLDRLTRVFTGPPPDEFWVRPLLKLMTIEDLRERLVETKLDAPTILSETVEGEYILRRYSPTCSEIIDFGEASSRQGPSRRDYVITYPHGPNQTEFHRDFFLSPNDWKSDESELYRAVFDLQHVLAIRRSGLFKLGFAQRVYTVLLPPAVVQNTTSPTEGYLFAPCVILYRVPRHGTFRRTFTLTFIAIPVNLVSAKAAGNDSSSPHIEKARLAGIDEIRALKSDLKAPLANDGLPPSGPSVHVCGPLARAIGVPPSCSSIPELVHRVSTYVASRVLEGGDLEPNTASLSTTQTRDVASRSAGAITFASSLESRVASMLLQVEWNSPPGETHPWEKWLRTGQDNSLRDNIYKLLFYEDFLAPERGYSSRRSVDLEAMRVGNTLGADMSGMTFFDPTDDLKLIVYPRQRERYPDYSIVRWMAFSIYADSALSSLQGMIQRFYDDLDQQGDLGAIVETLDDMIQSFVELYDLDIRLYFYRREYEKLRELLRVDRNYELLLSKFSSVKDDASLKEQRLFNKLLLAFTVSTVTVGILTTVATIKQWHAGRYLAWTLPAAIVLTLGAYLSFDPVRRFLARFS